MKSPFVDVKDVAEYLGVSKELVYRLCDPKKTTDPIPHFRLGKKMKFRLDANG
jgi:excisionase family DNA binding protein